MTNDDLRPRRRPRFSLLNLVLLVTIVAMGLVIAKLAPLQGEVRRLRDEAGHLVVTDRNRLHALELQSDSRLVWKWRVFVPADRSTALKVLIGDIPAAGAPVASPDVVVTPLRRDGEQTITMRVYRDLDGSLHCQVIDGDGHSGAWPLSEEQASITSGSGQTKGIDTSTAASLWDGKLVLFRKRAAIAPAKGAKLSTPGPGMLIWLE